MKYFKIIILLFSTFFLLKLDCNASVKTYTRTRDNLLVPKDVLVDETMIDSILVTPAVSSGEKVYDYANLLSDDEEKKIYEKLDEYIKRSKIDAIVVTTNDLGGKTLGDYTYNFYDYNEFMDDGVIFVIYMNQKNPEIYMGNSGKKDGNAFSIYTDIRINQTLEYVYKYIIDGNYYDAVNNYIKIVSGFYELDRHGDYRVNEEGEIVHNIPWVEIVILSLALTFIIVILAFSKYHKKNNLKSLEEKLDTSTLKVLTESDNLTNTIVSDKK